MTALKNCSTNGIVVVLTDEYRDFPKLVVDNIASVLNKRGYGLLCIAGRELDKKGVANTSLSACNAIYPLVNQHLIKGLISISGSIGHSVDTDTLTNFLHQFHLPMVSIGIPVPDTPSVLLDNLSGMEQLMDHLLSDPSRQELAYIRGYSNDPYSVRREDIFRTALKKHNREIDESLFIRGNYDKFETYTAVTNLLESGRQVDAIVAANDLMALSAARAITAKRLRIPRDISVTGFDDTREATQYSPALTTVRQPLEKMAEESVNLLLDTMDRYSGKHANGATGTPDFLTIKNELIKRGSTLGATRGQESRLVFSAEGIHELLRLTLSGLGLPQDVELLEIANAYWNTVDTGSDCLNAYFSQHSDSSISFEHQHWWSNLCFQLEHLTNLIVEHYGSFESEPDIRAILADAREKVWSATLDQEFKLNRLENLQNRMQLKMSSCTESSDIFVVLTEWLDTLGAKRSFLAQFEEPGSTAGEWAELTHVYRNGKVESCTDKRFRSNRILPKSLQSELEKGALVMCPVHAGNLLFGFILMDPIGLDHLDLETTSNSIGNAMRSQHLLQTLEKQKIHLQSANQELYTLAQYDSLTGLPNRLNFQNDLSHRCRMSVQNQSTFALLFIDLDGFKHVNDTLGHDAGDQLLQTMANRLIKQIEQLELKDTFVARLGGDEFTIILGDSKDSMEIVEIIEQLLETLSQSLSLMQQVVTVSSSVGCAVFPSDGSDADTLLKHADTAMYHAKAQGKNCMAFFKPEMSTTYSDFLQLDQEMRAALVNDDFCLYFQPKIDLASGNICGAEVLMRWLKDSSDNKTMHAYPDEFIPVAESTGFITQLDLFGLEQACQTGRRWESEGRPLPIAVNISVVFLQKDNFIDLVSEAIHKHKISPNLLEFEITESAVMTEVEENIDKIGQLRDMGIRISIDDFGTGYSSLSYLKKLPINCLKIDRSFISDIDSEAGDESVDESIVRSVVALGKSLDLQLVAEGVETQRQSDIVLQMGCELAQGYLFTKPLPLDEFEAFMNNWSSIEKAA